MYVHTQIGWTIILTLSATFLLLFLVSFIIHSAVGECCAFIMLIALLLFATLTVSVGKDSVELAFGIGLIRKHIKINEIVSSRIVRNKWWYGIGIHGRPGKGWLFNVSGADAVELIMENGLFYRIGTDEPQKLNEVIQCSLESKSVSSISK